MKTIHYPRKGLRLEDAVTQETFDRYFTMLENWRQGPGVFGSLNIHACWGTVDSLDKRYQGETVSHQFYLFRLYKMLYDRFREPRFRTTVDAMVAHLLYLQDASGGFIHSTSEFEPTFNTACCPIHAFHPTMELCEYYRWEYANETLKAQIPDAVRRHWEWAQPALWQIGNGGHRPLDFPGWCGVTNQDLTVVAALAQIGKTFGDWSLYETYGKPAVAHYFSPAYYYKEIGLFERGDGNNFPERTPYYGVILNRLKDLYELTGEERYREVSENVIRNLFEVTYIAEDGLRHMSRGVKTDPADKTKRCGFDRSSINFQSYGVLIPFMEEYLREHPDEEKAQILEELKSTAAAYLFFDAGFPKAFNPGNPIFTVVSTPDSEGLLQLMLHVLGDRLEKPVLRETPVLHRQYKNFLYKTNGRLWLVEKDGERTYGGYTRYNAGITIGADEKPVLGDYSDLDQCDILEIVTFN